MTHIEYQHFRSFVSFSYKIANGNLVKERNLMTIKIELAKTDTLAKTVTLAQAKALAKTTTLTRMVTLAKMTMLTKTKTKTKARSMALFLFLSSVATKSTKIGKTIVVGMTMNFLCQEVSLHKLSGSGHEDGCFCLSTTGIRFASSFDQRDAMLSENRFLP